MNLDGLHIAVFGLGVSGRAAAALAVHRGASRVVGVDSRDDVTPIAGVEMVPPASSEAALAEADLVVFSPGIAAAHPALAAREAIGRPILGTLGFAASFLDAPMVAVTGTNGKSTVTSFVGTLMGGPAEDVFVGGNLGTPLGEAALGPTPRAVVVEVSSYQLERPGTLAPDVAVILNLTPDHLARHGDMVGYAQAKATLFSGMGEGSVAFLPHDAPLLHEATRGLGKARRLHMGRLPGVSRTDRRVTVDLGAGPVAFDLTDVDLPGAHNLDHAATACALALAAGTAAADIQARLRALAPLPHRMQPVAELDGVLWINDSKATNVEAAAVGIGGLDRAAVVLLGGQAKGDGFAALAAPLRHHAGVVTFGGSGGAIADELARSGIEAVRAASLDDAVDVARAMAHPGQAVLLSPGCASFDAFDDFTHRGRRFAALARGEAP